MPAARRRFLAAALAAPAAAVTSRLAAGQGAARDAEEGGEVVIRRRALFPRDPRPYQTGLHLEPAKKITLVAPGLGTVASVLAEPGKEVAAGAALVTLDSEEQDLEVKRAEALSKAAGGGAEREAADLAVQIAKLRASRRTITAPFAGTVYRVPAVLGQPVRPGDALVELADASELIAEIPVDRSPGEPAPDAPPGSPPPGPPAVGGTVPISVEGEDAEAKITALLPLSERFEPVRDLVASPATARVTLPGGRFRDGQTVYVPVIPRDPVAEVPTEALLPAPDGRRLVQVVRENVVRDLPVRLLGQIGADRAFVAGPFAEGDEVILSASRELPDGTVLAAAAGPAAPAGGGAGRDAGGRGGAGGGGQRSSGGVGF